jgi:hypothetical protein
MAEDNDEDLEFSDSDILKAMRLQNAKRVQNEHISELQDGLKKDKAARGAKLLAETLAIEEKQLAKQIVAVEQNLEFFSSTFERLKQEASAKGELHNDAKLNEKNELIAEICTTLECLEDRGVSTQKLTKGQRERLASNIFHDITDQQKGFKEQNWFNKLVSYCKDKWAGYDPAKHYDINVVELFKAPTLDDIASFRIKEASKKAIRQQTIADVNNSYQLLEPVIRQHKISQNSKLLEDTIIKAKDYQLLRDYLKELQKQESSVQVPTSTPGLKRQSGRRSQ